MKFGKTYFITDTSILNESASLYDVMKNHYGWTVYGENDLNHTLNEYAREYLGSNNKIIVIETIYDGWDKLNKTYVANCDIDDIDSFTDTTITLKNIENNDSIVVWSD